MQRRFFTFGLVPLLTAMVVIAPSAGWAQSSPGDIVAAFHESLLGVMKKAKTLGVKGRFERLASPLKQSFHFRLMTQIAVSSYWRKADPARIDRLVDAFTRLSISTYASRFDGYSGQSFETESEKPGPQKTILVKTRIIDPGSDPVELTYVTRKIKGGLLVDIGVNVFLPASQVDIRRPADIGDYIGRTIQCVVLKIDEARRNIVVSRRQLIERGTQALSDIRTKGFEHVVVVSHGGLLAAALKGLLQVPAERNPFRLANCSITELAWLSDPVVARMNDVSHLERLHPDGEGGRTGDL
ncbi:MAG: ABC transporter substrate-binding protein [Proteobacteria bacterium]|nr:ABC transporter substrate-binding protein [Pseudomonadota bacterium]